MRTGFTITELLIVVAIIVVLIAILLPVVTKVRTSSYAASTKQEISVIETAITRYHEDFGAYPGPFSNDQIIGPFPPNQQATVQDTNSVSYPVTMSENCFLGLVGGLSGTYPKYQVSASAVGNGMLSFNPLNPKRYAPYIDGVTFSANSIASFSADSLGNPAPLSNLGLAVSGMDSPIPEFMDRFPSALPILYMRARVGAPGIISLGGQNLNGSPIPCQYDLNQILPYMNTVVNQNNLVALGPNLVIHPLAGLGPDAAPTGGGYALPPPPAPGSPSPDAIQYFMVWSAPFSGDLQTTGTPRGKDGYILISAGPDRLYGTLDDITSFGDVQQ